MFRALSAMLLAITIPLLVSGCSKGDRPSSDEVLILPDGQLFKCALTGELQGASITLLNKQPDGNWSNVGIANLDSPRHWLGVIRPQLKSGDERKRLWLTADGSVAVLAQNNECYLVYNVKNNACAKGPDLEAMSPFMLLDETAQLNQADAAKLLDDAKAGTHPTTGHPSKAALQAAQDNRNPNVRSFASELLKYYP